MTASRVTYLDSSAIVKLAVREPESAALGRHLRRRRPLVSSGLARTEVVRALLPLGEPAVRRGLDVLATLNLVRVSDRVLTRWSTPATQLRSLDAIHLATAQQFDGELSQVVTYDDRMAHAARTQGLRVRSPV